MTVIAACVASCRGVGTNLDMLYRRYKDWSMTDLKQLGQELLSRNSTDSALAVFTIMSDRYETGRRPEDKVYAAEAHNSLGVLSFLSSNYVDAYSHFVTAIEMDGRADAPGNLNLSAIYLYYGDYRRAYELLRKVFDEAVAKGHYYMASASLINILTADIDSTVVPEDSVADMIRRYNSRVPRTADNPGWALAAHLSRARFFDIKGNYDGAIREYKESLDASGSMLIPERNRFASYIGLGKTFHKSGQTDSAVFYMKKAEDLARDAGFTELLINTYSSLHDIYAETGNRRMADEYRHKKLELNDSLFNTREFSKIRDLEMFHEIDRFKKRISMMQIEKKMRRRTLVTVSVALLCVAALCILIFVQNRKLRRKNRNLYERNMAAMKAEEKLREAIQSQQETAQQADAGNASEPEEASEKYSGSSLSDSKGKEIEERIIELMADEKVFCREGFTIKELADLCGSNTKYVSQVLNERMDTTFSQLLNESRISVARKRFVDFEHYGHLTIEAIVAELGFKSRSTFSKTFKRITGLSPSEFQRMAREKRK